MQIHVTGANGLLGKCVVEALAPLGDVHATDVDEMDVTDPGSVMAVLEARRPDALVHLAALKGNQPSRERPLDFFRVNTVGTVNLLESCRRLGVGRFVFVSSLTVHGPGSDPVAESSAWDPIHPYAGSKGAAETMVRAYANSYGINGTIIRPNFIVGPIPAPQPYTDNIIYGFIEAVHDTGVIELAGDGQYQREWLHPRDVASAIALALSGADAGCEAYILSGHRVTMMELGTRVVQRIGRGRVVCNPDRDGFSLISSSEKARNRLGWEPQVSLDSVISEIWDEYRSRT